VAGRITELEKDLYYYKMTSREFKKKLRSVNRDGDHDVRQSSTEPAITNRDDTTDAGGDSALRSSGLSQLCLLPYVIISTQAPKYGNYSLL